MKPLMYRAALLGLALSALISCAQNVGDIDRTQPNKTLKTNLDGVWYMLETVSDVPSNSSATFEGETGKMEKIQWRIEENYIIAYRAYAQVPGSDNVDNPPDFGGELGDAYGNPVAMYPILSHFDIQRQYNPSTGEQTNVLIENTFDRPWFEREYMRIDWSTNLVVDFDFVSDWWASPAQASFQVDTERNEPRSIYRENDASGALRYFDVPRQVMLQPDFWGCIYSWWGWSTEDCSSSRVEIVTSFSKTAPERDYEPLFYNDNQMSRFGYFRSERYGFDPQRGAVESSRIFMINRHNLWKESYRKDAQGEFVRNEQGERIPIPITEREPRTVPYYLSATFPDDPLIIQASQDTINQWDAIGRETVALAKGVSVASIEEPVFTLCHNPVESDDHAACGEEGFVARVGDLRYSTLHWVEAEQLQGPLGYGPSATDPETGETVSGRAYVYGSALSTYATYGVDVIRFLNGDLEGDTLGLGNHFRAQVNERIKAQEGLERLSPQLRNVPLDSRRLRRRDRDRLTRRETVRRNPKAFDRQKANARLELAKTSGLSSIAGGGGDEYRKAIASRMSHTTGHNHSVDDVRVDPASWLNPTHFKQAHRRRMRAIQRTVDFPDMFDPHVEGIARAYEGRTDYDQIWRELRAEVYKATALHEVGHTLGLRHNFQGSYDSLNYNDTFWELRPENMQEPQSLYDIYALHTLTEKQIDGRMREFQYSSIMDYGLTFNSDLQGLGKYDRAAIVYGYTAGFTKEAPPQGGPCEGTGRVQDPDGGCLSQRLGFVEVFNKPLDQLGGAGDILSATDDQGFVFSDPTAPIVPYLERWHYTTFMRSFPSMDDAFDRSWLRIDEVEAARASEATDRPVRVPYLFCSDEWAGALMSCNVFDSGADPFELVKNIANRYRTYYYFNNFKRDRIGWDAFNSLTTHYYYTFLPLSDYYQNWYLAPEGSDELMDNHSWLAVNMSFNLLSEAIATPPYGTFCTGKNDQLVHLSDDPGGDPQQASDYILNTYCDQEKPFFHVKPGEGRRRFTRFNAQTGYYFADRPQEAGHYWTTLAAFWAMVDPEAFVLGSDADVGTFAISFYDFFSDEVNELVNAVITEDYSAYSPRFEIEGNPLLVAEGTLHHRIPRGIYDAEQRIFFNPENGEALSATLGPPAAGASICEPCSANDDCTGFTGALGGTYCQALSDDSEGTFCLQDCTDNPGACQDDETCDPAGNCVPNALSCDGRVQECSPEAPQGTCAEGQSCVEGTCQRPWPVVETDATFSLVDDMLFYGMLYTTLNFSTRYNDQINVFKMGTNEEIMPGEGFETASFVDPITGDQYGAVRESCDGGETAAEGGALGLCEPCTANTQCAGHTGFTDGTYCQPLSEDSDAFFCLQDCTNDPGLCKDDETCDPAGNCVPDSCDGRVEDCSPTNPLGSCEENSTCVEGTCVSTEGTALSPRCRYNLATTNGGTLVVERGNVLTERYNETLEAYWADDGSDPERETQYYRDFSRAQFELENHVEKINDIRAVYGIFGKVY